MAKKPEVILVETGKKIAEGRASIEELTAFLDLLLPETIDTINTTFSWRQLIKATRSKEPLPIAKKKLSSFRTRIGTMLEYALCTQMDQRIQALFKDDLRLSFAVAHEYPDFFIRDAVLGQRVRIEMKAVDAESDEQAARFEVLQSLIQEETDLVVILGWEWKGAMLPNKTNCELPQIFSYIVVPASELARERDRSVELRGGRVEADRILVPARKTKKLVPDRGNAGKILRLVHTKRKAEPFNLSQPIQKYIQFCQGFSERAQSKADAKGSKTVKKTKAARTRRGKKT